MEVQVLESTGPVQDVLRKDAFKVHDIMFNVRDVVQCLMYCSRTMYVLVSDSNCNMFSIVIDTEAGSISSLPMVVNDYYNECVIRNNEESTAQLRLEEKKNTYQLGENKIILFLTKGFIIDNFVLKESYHDFKPTEDSATVILHSTDIESLTVANPGVQ